MLKVNGPSALNAWSLKRLQRREETSLKNMQRQNENEVTLSSSKGNRPAPGEPKLGPAGPNKKKKLQNFDDIMKAKMLEALHKVDAKVDLVQLAVQEK